MNAWMYPSIVTFPPVGGKAAEVSTIGIVTMELLVVTRFPFWALAVPPVICIGLAGHGPELVRLSWPLSKPVVVA